GNEAHAFGFADEAHHAAAVGLDRERDRRRRRQPPAQETLHRAHALGAFGHPLAPIDRGRSRAQRCETKRQPRRQQGGGKQDFNQGESALPCTQRSHATEAVATADINNSPAKKPSAPPDSNRLPINQPVAAPPSSNRLAGNEAVATADINKSPAKTAHPPPTTNRLRNAIAIPDTPSASTAPRSPTTAQPPTRPHPPTPEGSGCTSRSDSTCSRSRAPPSPQRTSSDSRSSCGANGSTGCPGTRARSR